VWLIGATVCLLAAPWVQLSVSAGNGWAHNALRHHWLMPISCHFRDCKALLVELRRLGGGLRSLNYHVIISAGPQVSYGGACVPGDVCVTDNAVCQQGRCQCRDGFGLNATATTTTCGALRSYVSCSFSVILKCTLCPKKVVH